MTEKELDEALAFYGISEEDYTEAMLRCLREIQRNVALSAAFTAAEEKLFYGPFPETYMMSACLSKEMLFGREMPMHSTNLLLLSGYELHRQNRGRYPLDAAQRSVNLTRVQKMLRLCPVSRGETVIGGVFWGAQFVRMRVAEIGRLQFEYMNADCSFPEALVNVHIPDKGRLERAEVDAAFAAAGPYLEKLYGSRGDRFVCTSWLLSPQLAEMVSPESNLGYFRSLFQTEENIDCTADVLHYVFHAEADTPTHSLPETTSLQKKVKQYLLGGGRFHYGRGIREYDAK